MDYKYGNKAQWRRYTWNRICERTSDRRGIVLFLPGSGALDVPVAKRKGFSERNMIAVERDPLTIKSLRGRGQLVVEGDLFEVLTAWPVDKPVDVVVADLCCGLTSEVWHGVHGMLINPAFSGATFAFNLLRGRDAFSAEMIRNLHVAFEQETPETAKHRGLGLINSIIGVFIAAKHTADAPIDDQEAARLHARFVELMRPTTYSYRSTAGNQWFDTVVFCHPFRQLRDVIADVRNSLPPLTVSKSQVRRTAAVLAHHTMRAGANV